MVTCGFAMSLNVKVAGAWKDVSTAHVKVGGVWRAVADGWVKVAGVWKQVYSSLAAFITNTPLTGSNVVLFPPTPATASVTAILEITGTGPFTYSWHLTGTHSFTSSPTGASFTISLQQGSDIATSGAVWCDVTDAYGQTVTTDAEPWSLSLTTGGP